MPVSAFWYQLLRLFIESDILFVKKISHVSVRMVESIEGLLAIHCEMPTRNIYSIAPQKKPTAKQPSELSLETLFHYVNHIAWEKHDHKITV